MYILSDGYDVLLKQCEEELEKNGGDYFALLEWMFQKLVEDLQETRTMMDVVRNVFSSQEGEALFGIDGCMFHEVHAENTGDNSINQWIFERLDLSRYPYHRPEEFAPLLRMGMITLTCSVRWYAQNMEKAEEAKRYFYENLDVLKYGVYGMKAEKRGEQYE